MTDRTERFRTELRNLSIATAILVAIPTALSLVSSIHPLVDQVVHFREIYLMGALIALPGLIVERHRVALVALAAIAVNAWFIAPYAASPIRSATAHAECSPEMKVLALNAYGPASDHDALLELVEQEDPDVLFVSELRPGLAKRIAAEFPHHVWRDGAYQQFGLFTKYPIAGGVFMQAPNGRPTINAVLDAPQGKLRVIGAHPTSPNGTETIVNRNAMLKQIADAVSDSPEPVVILGDLNVTMFSPNYQVIEDAGMTNARAGRGVQGTWPDWSPLRIPIDHVLVSPELSTCSMSVLDSFGSDHLPLVASIARR